MPEQFEDLERRMERLRADIRHHVLSGDRSRASALRAELRRSEGEWEQLLTKLSEEAEPPEEIHIAGPLLPVREQVHHALTLLAVPSAPRMIIAVHSAFFGTAMSNARLTSLRRDEEKSFNVAPFARPFYICCALTHDLLAPARGLLAISTWPMEQRVVGPLSARVDFLRAAINVSDAVARLAEPGTRAKRLLWSFASSIPGADQGVGAAQPGRVAEAAKVELAVHEEADTLQRRSAARRARSQLDETAQLFGSRLRRVSAAGEMP